MALEHGDLFFVNRSAATYKIEALEIGEYLISNELPSGNYFVNNGLLSIANTGNDALTAPIGLHSANSPDNSILDFDKHFVVQKAGSDATVTLNFSEIKESFLCNSGVNSGFDINNCDCLALDFEYIADKLTWCHGGITGDNGCFAINYCSDGLLTLAAREGNCLDVKICSDAGIDISGGCIGLDKSWITNNISCGDPDSGLTIDSDCLAVDFDKVLAKIDLGIIKSTDQTVQFLSGGNKDLKVGDVDLSVDWTKNPNNSAMCKAKLTIMQDGVPKGTYDPCKSDQTITIDGGGSGNNPPPGGDTGGCVNGGILLDTVNDCLYLDKSDNGCTEQSFINCAGINVRKSTGISFNTAGSSVAGVNLNVRNKSFRLEYDSSIQDGSGACAQWGKGVNVLRVSLGGTDPDSSGRLFRSECFKTMGDDTGGKDDDEGVAYINSVTDGRHQLVIDPNRRASYPQYITEDDKINYQARKDNPELYENENPYQNFYDASPPNVEEATDTASLDVIGCLNTDLDSIIDTLGKSKSDGGLFRWAKVKDSETGKLNLFFDANELGTLHPWLAKGHLSKGSYEGRFFEDDNDLWVEGDLKPEDQRSIKYYQVDHDAVAALSFIAHKRAKQRITELETQVATLEARLTAAGIP